MVGTNRCLANVTRNLVVTYNRQLNNVTTSYKYLGVELTNPLHLNSQFDKNYKKELSRLKTLHRIRRLSTNDI